MRFDGTIKAWNDERGFGFIEPAQGGQEIFVHAKAFRDRTSRPLVGQRVTFEVELNPEGKKRARGVEPYRAPRALSRSRGSSPAQWGTASFFAIPAFFAVYLAASVLWGVSGWIAAIYLGASAVTYVVYASDKAAAAAGRWRVSEATLLGLGVLCGWPGAIVAQQVLRHKSNKASFRTAFWGTVMVNVAGFLLLASPYLQKLLHA